MAEYGILITAIMVVVTVVAILLGSNTLAMFNGDAARV
jgi:hypothetical protein